jgi:hypothetical protein
MPPKKPVFVEQNRRFQAARDNTSHEHARTRDTMSQVMNYFLSPISSLPSSSLRLGAFA